MKIAGNIHLSYYVEAADQLGIKYEIIVPGLMARFTSGDKCWFIINTVTPLNNTPSCTIAKRKSLTNLVLGKSGIPVPKQAKIYTADDAVKFFNEVKNIVLKPAQAIGGHGVSILPHTEDEVRQAFQIAIDHSLAKEANKVLAEEFIVGENYRMLVLGDKVIGIVHRIAAHVIGNGLSNIKQLIADENTKRQAKLLKPIPIDQETEKRLALYNFVLDSIPTNGQEVILRFNANLSTGGTTEECAAITHQFYKDLAVKAVKTIGLTFGGVDLITPDITQPAKCAINEINYNPGLRPHYKPDHGEIVKVAVPIMEYIKENM